MNEAVSKINHLGAPSFHKEFAKTGRPVIFTSKTKTDLRSDAVEQTILYLGSKTVKVRTGDYAEPTNYITNRKYVEKTLSDFIPTAINGTADIGYAANIAFPKYIALKMGVAFPFYQRIFFERPTLWIGPAGSATPLHTDSSDNFIQQLVGNKRLLIFPPREIPYLYMSAPFPNNDPGFLCSSLDLRKKSPCSLKKYNNSHVFEVILSPGEILYLPAGWAHFVESVSFSITANTWLNNKKIIPVWTTNR